MTKLLPVQEKAREHLHRKGTLLAPREIHERVRAAFAATEAFLGGVSEREARARPAPGEWCVQEIVDHVAQKLLVRLYIMLCDRIEYREFRRGGQPRRLAQPHGEAVVGA